MAVGIDPGQAIPITLDDISYRHVMVTWKMIEIPVRASYGGPKGVEGHLLLGREKPPMIDLS